MSLFFHLSSHSQWSEYRLPAEYFIVNREIFILEQVMSLTERPSVGISRFPMSIPTYTRLSKNYNTFIGIGTTNLFIFQ